MGSLPSMPALRRFDVDELLTRPGTYFNPQTEIVVVVDDSAHVDLELLDDDAEDDEAEWILLGDDVAIDEHQRDELVEAFATRLARRSAREDPAEDEPGGGDELEVGGRVGQAIDLPDRRLVGLIERPPLGVGAVVAVGELQRGVRVAVDP